MIGILSAMDDEIRLLIGDLERRDETTIAGRRYLRGTLYGRDVVLALSRWGKVAAAQTATTLINTFGVSKVIFTGVAGGVDPSLEIGDIVISTELVQHDVDASAVPPMKRFEIPLLGISHFASDATLLRQAVQAAAEYASGITSDIETKHLDTYRITAPRVTSGLTASGDLFIADPNKTAELREALPGLQCIEMEGAAVAQVCYEHGIPFVVIRAISDKADHSAVIDFPQFVEYIAAHYSRGIIRGMLS